MADERQGRADRGGRRLDDLVVPVVVVVAVALLATYWAMRPETPSPSPTGQAAPAPPSATPSATDDVSPAGASDDPAAGRQPRRSRLPAPVEPLASELPAPSCPAPEPPVRVTVVDLNTAGAPTRDGYDHDLLARELASWQADVLLLQEVDRPALLARALDMEVAHDPVTGATVLSRYRIDASGTAVLPGRPRTPVRGVLAARLDVGGDPVDVYTAQLEEGTTPGAEPLREAQAQALHDIVTSHELPTLLGGDLGTPPGTPPVRLLTAGRLMDSWGAVGDGGGQTVPANQPRSRHDYLLADRTFAPVGADLLRSDVASHLGVRVTYDVTTAPACLPPGSVN